MGSNRQQITVVPTVKAYPALLGNHEEAVCVAGFRTELMQQPEWIRLFPVPFRELQESQKFRKWERITLEAEPSPKDHRPESWLPYPETIEVHGQLNGAEREALVESMPHVTMCGLHKEQQQWGTSLGVVRPREVVDLIVEHRDPAEVETQQVRVNQAASQQKLLGPELTPLEVLPHRFVYRYRCYDPGCRRPHNQGIIDWEISQAYRKWRNQYDDVEEQVRRKWLDEMCGPDRETRFFVGNMHQYPQSFLVLGVFAPKRS